MICSRRCLISLLIFITIGSLIAGIQIPESRGIGQSKSTISVTIENHAYFAGDSVNISGSVYDAKGFPVSNDSVTIKVSPYDPNGIVVYQTSVNTRKNGMYNDQGLRLSGSSVYDFLQLLTGSRGEEMSKLFSQKYNVTALTVVNGVPTAAWTQLEIKGYFLTFPSILLYAGLLDLFLLLVVLAIPSTEKQDRMVIKPTRMLIKKILIFLFISGIVLSPIASLFLTDSEAGINSPIGLIKKHIQSDQGQSRDEWVINFGGRLVDGNVFGGVQVPIYIFIFGIAGGYLRYLYDIAKERDGKKEPDSKTEHDKDVPTKNNPDLDLFYSSLGSLSIIFVSPLLALAIYFVLFQGGTTSNQTLAAIGITVGLLMKEVVQTITGFAEGLMKAAKDRKGGD